MEPTEAAEVGDQPDHEDHEETMRFIGYCPPPVRVDTRDITIIIIQLSLRGAVPKRFILF